MGGESKALTVTGYGSELQSSGASEDASHNAALVELESHDLFKSGRLSLPASLRDAGHETRAPHLGVNLIACDGSGRLFAWDSKQKQLLHVDIQSSDSPLEFSGLSGTLLASKGYQTVQLSLPVDFEVLKLVFNRTGRSLVLAGDGAVMVVNLPFSISTSSGFCRALRVGTRQGFSTGDGQWLRILQIEWHPHSDTHLGLLSSDGCLRLFDLSLDAENPEQEYYLHPKASRKAGSALIRAIAFAFGGEHLWDRFTVFVLYNDGSLFALCPVVPFGSLFRAAAIDELAKDARQVESLTDRPQGTAKNASIALVWLEAVFPELASIANGGSGESVGSVVLLRSHAYVPLDASLLLQGPLPTLCRRVVGSEVLEYLEETSDASGQAVGLLYNVIGKDSVLAVSTREGQVRVYALADEIQPIWESGKPPQLSVDDEGHLLAVGMLVESSFTDAASALGNERKVEEASSAIWAGSVPPLLQLAIVDLALQPAVAAAGPVTLYTDSIVPERLYCQHAAGLDAILLRWLPFSSQHDNKSLSEALPPAVFSILDICATESTSSFVPLGVAFMSDTLGESWVVTVTANCECVVVNLKPRWALPESLIGDVREEKDSAVSDGGVMQMMSRELLLGPRTFPITQLTSSGSSLTLESVEGRAFVHDQCKLLREQYIEYAHRVYVEVTSHCSRLRDMVLEQQRTVKKAEENLLKSRSLSNSLSHRIEKAILKNQSLELRVKAYNSLKTVTGSPLSLSEREFKSQLDTMRLQDLDILTSAVEVLSSRSERFLHEQTEPSETSSYGSPARKDKVAIPDSQMWRLKQAVEQINRIVQDSSLKVKAITETIAHRELLRER